MKFKKLKWSIPGQTGTPIMIHYHNALVQQHIIYALICWIITEADKWASKQDRSGGLMRLVNADLKGLHVRFVGSKGDWKSFVVVPCEFSLRQ